MTTNGAYSKKYQYMEKERLRQMKDHARKSDRDRVHRLSKQTAQRQRALEEKKMAMAAAEEERRKKALEDRRKAQKEATDRFKSAFSRAKTTSRGSAANTRGKQLNIEYYLPNKLTTKVKSVSQKRQPSGGGSVGERVALGREVELGGGRQYGLQKRTPSLDDVLNQIRGEHQAGNHPQGHHIPEQGHIFVHKGYYSQQNADGRIVGPGMLLKGRSASDTSLNIKRHQESIEAQHTQSESTPPGQSSLNSKPDARSIVISNGSDENIVFHPVTNKPFHSHASAKSGSEDDLRITSPELPESSSSSDLSDRSSSPSLNDSLDSTSGADSGNIAMKLRTRQNFVTPPRPSNSTSVSQIQHSELTGVHTGMQAHPPSHAPSQPIYTCEDGDSSSSSDSPIHNRPRPTPPRSRRQTRHQNESKTQSAVAPSTSNQSTAVNHSIPAEDSKRVHSTTHSNVSGPLKKSPKIVGILKKPSSQSSSKATSAVTTAYSSQVTSAATSILMDGSQDGISGNVSTKSLKRVRFKDHPDSPDKSSKVIEQGSFIDSARIELWKRVLPNGFSTHFLPNSAFTPRMRVSLSPKQVVPPGISGPPRKPNGITVHVPVMAVENSPSPPHIKHSTPATAATTMGPDSNQELESGKESRSEVLPTTLKEKYEQANTGSGAQLQVNPNVESDPTRSASDHLGKGNDHTPPSVGTNRTLDKTPTDDDINEMWDEIRNTLHDNKRVSISPQVFNFKVPVEEPPHQYCQYGNRGSLVNDPSLSTMIDEQHSHSHGHVPPAPGPNSKSVAPRKQPQSYNGPVKQSTTTGTVVAPHKQSSGNSQRQLVHRQNRVRTMRCHNELHSPVQLWDRHTHSHAATYPHTNQEQLHLVRSQPNVVRREPELVVRAASGGSNMRNAPTALSLEEKQIMQSIEQLDQRMKDHLGRPQNVPVRMSHVSPEPPDFSPEYYPHPPPSTMPPHPHPPPTRGPNNNLPKSRVHRNTTKAVVNNRSMNNSRTHYRHPAQRKVLYST